MAASSAAAPRLGLIHSVRVPGADAPGYAYAAPSALGSPPGSSVAREAGDRWIARGVNLGEPETQQPQAPRGGDR